MTAKKSQQKKDFFFDQGVGERFFGWPFIMYIPLTIGEAEDFFSVLSNGTLVSSRGLDRELQASYSFIVKAVDGGKSAAAGRNSATATVKLDLEVRGKIRSDH